VQAHERKTGNRNGIHIWPASSWGDILIHECFYRTNGNNSIGYNDNYVISTIKSGQLTTILSSTWLSLAQTTKEHTNFGRLFLTHGGSCLSSSSLHVENQTNFLVLDSMGDITSTGEGQKEQDCDVVVDSCLRYMKCPMKVNMLAVFFEGFIFCIAKALGIRWFPFHSLICHFVKWMCLIARVTRISLETIPSLLITMQGISIQVSLSPLLQFSILPHFRSLFLASKL
jgi:hypothetical protein